LINVSCQAKSLYGPWAKRDHHHVLAISGQHVAVIAAVIYFALRLLAVSSAYRTLTMLALIWLYILVAGTPPSAIRAGVVATFVLAAGLFGRQIAPLHCTN
jgi:competence protein ComEC